MALHEVTQKRVAKDKAQERKIRAGDIYDVSKQFDFGKNLYDIVDAYNIQVKDEKDLTNLEKIRLSCNEDLLSFHHYKEGHYFDPVSLRIVDEEAIKRSLRERKL